MRARVCENVCEKEKTLLIEIFPNCVRFNRILLRRGERKKKKSERRGRKRDISDVILSVPSEYTSDVGNNPHSRNLFLGAFSKTKWRGLGKDSMYKVSKKSCIISKVHLYSMKKT